jgi:hypothetical protein
MKKYLLLLLLVSANVFGQALPATDPIPRVAFPFSNIGNISTVGPLTADAANAAKFSYGVAANGAVFANSGASMPTAGGASIPLAVAGEIPKVSVAGAISRFATKVVFPLQVGIALYDLAKELGFGVSRTGSGPIQVTKDGPAGAPAYYRHGFLPQHSTREAACSAYITYVMTANPDYTVVQSGLTGTSCGGTMRAPDSTTYPIQSGTADFVAATASGAAVASTVEALKDAIVAKGDWPATSALGRTVVDAIKNGEAVQVEPKSVTGPASSPVAESVTNNQTNTTTRTTTNNYTYNGPNITTTTTTTTRIVNNSDGLPAAPATTETTKPIAPTAAITCGLPDTPACLINESGTPPEVLPENYKTQIDKYKDDVDKLREKAAGSTDKDFFSQWGNVFITPPLAACTGIALPSGAVINPCGMVDGMRAVMAYLWALSAFWLCLGWIREVV